MRATIKDVAKLAGVSIKTVSNVINGYPYLREETKAKVEKALAELDYRPNIAARNLRRGRTGVIALALPNLSSPYFAELASLVVKEARERELTVLVDATNGDLEREKLVVEGFRSQLLDGIILQPWSVSMSFLRSRVDQTPLVLLGEHRQVKTADSVAIDSHAAAYAAVEHLLKLGRRRIVAIGAQRGGNRPGHEEPGRRHQGYEDALAAYDVPFDPELLCHPGGDHAPEAVAAALEDLLGRVRDIDGIFTFNDKIGMAAMRTLISRGIRVPDDIAMVSIDDIEVARVLNPSLSTIAPDKIGIARTALEMLSERISGSDRPTRQVVADFTLIARESAPPIRVDHVQ